MGKPLIGSAWTITITLKIAATTVTDESENHRAEFSR